METIYGKDLDLLIGQQKIVLIDVRDKEDYRRKHISGAYNLPYSTHKNRLRYLNKNFTYVLCCTHGVLSYQIAKKMEREGYQVMSLMNGIEKYHGKYLKEENKD